MFQPSDETEKIVLSFTHSLYQMETFKERSGKEPAKPCPYHKYWSRFRLIDAKCYEPNYDSKRMLRICECLKTKLSCWKTDLRLKPYEFIAEWCYLE